MEENQREKEMINFMDEVNKTVQAEEQEKRLANTPQAKHRVINLEKEKGREICLDTIFNKIYKDALPLTPEFKEIHSSDLDKDFHGFVKDKAPKGLEYYVRESIRKGNKTGQMLLESVNDLVNKVFFERELNIKTTDVDELKFDPETDQVQKGLQNITDKMGTEDISEIIRDNVKQAALNDIERQKKHDEDMKAIVDELKNDPTITTEAMLDRKMGLRGIGGKKYYAPSLFEGIMVNKTNLIKESGEDLSQDEIGKAAFFESVKELTKLSVLHNLGFEPIGVQESKFLAQRYADMRVPNSRVDFFQETVEDTDKNFLLSEERVAVLESFKDYDEELLLTLETTIEEMDPPVELMMEGANMEIRKEFIAERKNIKREIRAMKKAARHNDYREAKRLCESVADRIHRTQERIKKIDADSAISLGFSFFTGNAMFIGRTILGMLVFPIKIFNIPIQWTKRVEVSMNDFKEKKEMDLGDFNRYRNGILVRLREYERTCRKYAKKLGDVADGKGSKEEN